ncbi:hypothetical protein Tco_0650224 [Tanacetum coccineum]
MEDEEVPLVDGVFMGALGALEEEGTSYMLCVRGVWLGVVNESLRDVLGLGLVGDVVILALISTIILHHPHHHLLGEMKIHDYDGRRLKRRSDGLFHDHFGVDGSRKVGMIWSFSVLGVCKSTKIPFVCEYGLTSEWDSEDLTELLERESDEFVLNHEGDKNDAGVISLKSDLTIKV